MMYMCVSQLRIHSMCTVGVLLNSIMQHHVVGEKPAGLSTTTAAAVLWGVFECNLPQLHPR